jgi:DNA polymerase-3 subunit epsilon
LDFPSLPAGVFGVRERLLFLLKRQWRRWRLRDRDWLYLLDDPPADEWVSIDCETTGLDRERDEIVSIGAVKIRGNQLLTSEKKEWIIRPEGPMSSESIRIHQLRHRDLESGVGALVAVRELLEFVGSRPLIGYYLEFDVAMINRIVKPLLGIPLPQRQIDVSGMFYDLKYQQNPHQFIDLRFQTMMSELNIPTRTAHQAINDAIMTALAFIKLRALRG